MPTARLISHRPRYRRALAFVVPLILLATVLTLPAQRAQAAAVLLSQGKPTTASSVELGDTPATAATDGDPDTRWSSEFSDPQWLQVDLGGTATISQVTLRWEAAYGSAFQIQVSANPAGPWQTIYQTAAGTGDTQDLTVSGTGRHIRLYGTARGTAWGYSLWEFEVYGTSGSTCTGNAALGRDVTASSVESATTPATAAVDGNTATRWSSAFADPQWLWVDLGAVRTICQVVLRWEAAAARAFELQTADSPAGPWTTRYATTTGAGGVQTLDVSGAGRYVRMYGTARNTPYGYSLWEFVVRTTGSEPPPPSDDFWGDTSTIPPAQNVLTVKILNRTNGRYPDSQVYWSFGGQTRSIAEQPYLDMPANSAGRMYFHLGSPTSQYRDFVEFTVAADRFNGNTTRVDAFGLPLAMRLRAGGGYDRAVGETETIFTEGRDTTFQRFSDAMPAEFKHLATIEAPYRVPSPGNTPQFRSGGQYADYLSGYASSVGIPATTAQIFGCSGPLASNPDGCAALNRHVAHLPRSQWEDPHLFYQQAPANYYAKFWHEQSIDGLSYGFPYDDVADQSSFISAGDPEWLIVAVGW
ncbi:discoidin domain-containing protein [Salinispora pacifica]|uniref:discoidin domain-containing protein n=1 Tax=Salinispora pacifica TaxID=351187 RepID=UPI00039EBA78|nr:discoidin domain-containing protein [Salinispora pacifica]